MSCALAVVAAMDEAAMIAAAVNERTDMLYIPSELSLISLMIRVINNTRGAAL